MLHVLVVDDNSINAKLLRLTLEARGWIVHVAADASEAMTHLLYHRPHVVLLDVQLPGIDGLTLLGMLRDDPAFSDLPIAMVTSYASADDERRAHEVGCDAFVPKPINTRTIGDPVQSLALGRR